MGRDEAGHPSGWTAPTPSLHATGGCDCREPLGAGVTGHRPHAVRPRVWTLGWDVGHVSWVHLGAGGGLMQGVQALPSPPHTGEASWPSPGPTGEGVRAEANLLTAIAEARTAPGGGAPRSQPGAAPRGLRLYSSRCQSAPCQGSSNMFCPLHVDQLIQNIWLAPKTQSPKAPTDQ